MSLADRIMKIDRRIIYALIFIVIFLFSLKPMGIPVVTQPWVIDTYKLVESLQPGDKVLICWSLYPVSNEQIAGAVVILQHLCMRGIKTVHFQTQTAVDLVDDVMLNKVHPESYGQVYGKDWLWLGYISGLEAGQAAIAQNLKGTVTVDKYGNQLSQYSLWNELTNDARQFKFVLSPSAETPGTAGVLRQFQIPYGLKIVESGSAFSLGSVMPFYASKQYWGMVAGFPDCAAYEKLIGKPGIGSRSTDPLSAMGLLVFGLLLVSNIAYIISKLGGKGGSVK